jgi:hypothetical protein
VTSRVERLHVTTVPYLATEDDYERYNPKGKTALERHGSRWDDIKMDLTQIGWVSANCFHLAQDKDQWQAPANNVTNRRVS